MKYGIVAVQYDEDHSRITNVKVRTITGNVLGEDVTTYTRYAVVKGIDVLKYEFVTVIERTTKEMEVVDTGVTILVLKSDKKSFEIGETVGVFELGGEKFIKTDPNETEKDNLGDMPEF